MVCASVLDRYTGHERASSIEFSAFFSAAFPFCCHYHYKTNYFPHAVDGSASHAHGVNLSFIFRNQMDLETALYCLVFQMLVCQYWAITAEVLAVVAVLLACTRPEGLFLLLGLAGAVYVFRPGTKSILLGLCGLLCCGQHCLWEGCFIFMIFYRILFTSRSILIS